MELQQRLNHLESKIDLILQYLTPTQLKQITVAEYLAFWLDNFRLNVSPGTLYKDTNNVNNHITPLLGQMQLTDIDLITAQKYINSIKAPRQQQHIYVLLKHSFRKALELGYIETNPFNNVVLGSHEPTPTAILSDTQLKLFFELCPKAFYVAFYTLAFQGMRPSELLALTSNSITADGISITSSYDSKHKINGKTKTKQSVRLIPYFADVKQLLPCVCSRLFPYELRHLEDAFKKTVKHKDFSPSEVPRLSLYSLRHTCITNWAKSGVHPKLCMKWAGHNNLATTMRYYTHIDRDWEKSEVAKTKTTI